MANNVSGALDSLLTTGLSFYAPLADAGDGAVSLVASGAGASQAATFTRATDATTVDANGLIIPVSSGVARSYYDPTTLQYRGYLAEGARTNLCLRSNQFDTTWGNTRSSDALTGGVTAPDGSASSWKIIEDSTAGNTHLIAQNVTIATATTYTFSVWIKAGERTFARILVGDTGGNNAARVDVNLTDGTLANGTTSGTGWTYLNSTSQQFPNGWWKVSVTGTSAASTAGIVIIYLASALGTITYNGDNTSGIYLWGAQLEAGTFPSTYIPTEGSAVTRNADVLTYPFAGNADSTVGTCYAEYYALNPTADQRILGVNDGTANNRLFDMYLITTTTQGFYGSNAAVGQFNIDVLGVSTSSLNKGAGAYATNRANTALNGTAGTAYTTVSLPASPTEIQVGHLVGTSQGFMALKNIRLFTAGFTDTQLQAITSG